MQSQSTNMGVWNGRGCEMNEFLQGTPLREPATHGNAAGVYGSDGEPSQATYSSGSGCGRHAGVGCQASDVEHRCSLRSCRTWVSAKLFTVRAFAH
jgi:hypothetical protein